MAEPFDYRPTSWIRQSGKGRAQFIHNQKVVECLSIVKDDFSISDFCFLNDEPRVGSRTINEVGKSQGDRGQLPAVSRQRTPEWQLTERPDRPNL